MRDAPKNNIEHEPDKVRIALPLALVVICGVLVWKGISVASEHYLVDREAWLLGSVFVALIFTRFLWRRAVAVGGSLYPIFDRIVAGLSDWFTDSRKMASLATVLLLLLLAWMFAYETNPNGYSHRNRFTGAVCDFHKSCW